MILRSTHNKGEMKLRKFIKKISLLALIVVVVVVIMGATPILFKGLSFWRVEAKTQLSDEGSIVDIDEEEIESDKPTEEIPLPDEDLVDRPLEEIPTSPKNNVEKVAYLTFDDGPTPSVTSGILDVLWDHKIKATFFVIGNLVEQYPSIALRAHNEGHLISNHTYSHNYKYIYSTPTAFMEDLIKGEQVLNNLLGDEYNSKIIRFPGGSFGEGKRIFRETVVEKGFDYVDWNVLNGDAEAVYVPVEKQLQRIEETLKGKKQAIILLHDSGSKKTTVEALPLIIEYLQQEGYVFKTLDEYQF